MKISVGILGASGAIGEEYIRLLKNHPWFEITFLASSDKRIGEKSPTGIEFSSLEDFQKAKKNCRFLFSALPNSVASKTDDKYVEHGFSMVSHASCHRMREDVPLIIPEVNPEHLSSIAGKKNFIIAKPNCALLSFLLPLAPLHKVFGIEKISVTTLQSLSGAGNLALANEDMQKNIIPYITEEEEKLEKEPQKILGASNLVISAHCNRVPTTFGHYACTSVSFSKKPKREEILKLWQEFEGPNLPSADKHPLVYVEDESGPQIRTSLRPMSVTLGRLRACSLLDFRFVGLSHNTIRGGAGGGILIAELLHKKGLI